MVEKKNVISTDQLLLDELSQLIEQNQQQVVAQANSTLTMLFWHIGRQLTKTSSKINGRARENKLSLRCHDK